LSYRRSGVQRCNIKGHRHHNESCNRRLSVHFTQINMDKYITTHTCLTRSVATIVHSQRFHGQMTTSQELLLSIWDCLRQRARWLVAGSGELPCCTSDSPSCQLSRALAARGGSCPRVMRASDLRRMHLLMLAGARRGSAPMFSANPFSM